MKKRLHLLRDKTLHTIGLGVLCSLGAFAIGIETAGEVHPFSKSQAAIQELPFAGAPLHGDANGNGILDAGDAKIILEIAEGLETAKGNQVRLGDTDGDYQLTAKDALWVLYRLSQ